MEDKASCVARLPSLKPPMPSGRTSAATEHFALPALAARICKVARDVRDEHEAWVGIDRISDRLGNAELRTVDAAIAFASAKGWLSIGGSPAHSVLLKCGAP